MADLVLRVSRALDKHSSNNSGRVRRINPIDLIASINAESRLIPSRMEKEKLTPEMEF